MLEDGEKCIFHIWITVIAIYLQSNQKSQEKNEKNVAAGYSKVTIVEGREKKQGSSGSVTRIKSVTTMPKLQIQKYRASYYYKNVVSTTSYY